jgi:hypothetical protein
MVALISTYSLRRCFVVNDHRKVKKQSDRLVLGMNSIRLRLMVLMFSKNQYQTIRPKMTEKNVSKLLDSIITVFLLSVPTACENY